MAVTRPLKEGSVPTYQQKVALGFPDILASEMDADLDTIYAAWNGGVGTADLGNGSVTSAKIAPGNVEGSAPGMASHIRAKSIWGANDLADASISKTQLGPGETVTDAVEAATSGTVEMLAAQTTIATAGLTMRGSRLAILQAVLACYWQPLTTAACAFNFFLTQDGATVRTFALTPTASTGMLGATIPFAVVLRYLIRPTTSGARVYTAIGQNTTIAAAHLLVAANSTVGVYELS